MKVKSMDIPILYYPLTILCIDDEMLMLNTLRNYINSKFPVKVVTSPIQAQSMIDNQKTIINQYINELIIKCQNYEDDNNIHLNIQFDKLLKLIAINNKSEEIGVIVVDFMMPEKDGIMFCHDNQHVPIKKILLTGHQDFQLVLNAFSKRIIDAFLQKSQENLFSELLESIHDLTISYFNNATQKLRSIIETQKKLPISDDKFKVFFYNIVKDMEVKQWIIVDLNGSFLFTNVNNQHLYFIIHTDESLNNFTSLYNDAVFYPFMDPIKSRTKIPFFGCGIDPADVEITKWGHYLFEPHVFVGEQVYYWSLINVKDLPNVTTD